MKPQYHQWLLELTNLPTASGAEDRVIDWVEQLVRRHRTWQLKRDRYGNLTILHKNTQRSRKPIYITAHLDHPAFVVHEIISPRELIAEFRGGVKDSYFQDTKVLLHHNALASQKGVVTQWIDPTRDAKKLKIKFRRPVTAQKGDVITWDVGSSQIKKTGKNRSKRLHAPACDDMAGVAAAIAAFDAITSQTSCLKIPTEVRLLLTRAEEVAFIGAIAACKAKTVPKGARLICLENSKSYAESPIGGGPIVRVGDATSTFDPDLTYRISQIARHMQAKDKNFQWQRRLMPGGTCEASAFQAYGYISTCLCLPLGNYHNMNETTGKIASEIISIDDYDGLVRLLIAIARGLDDPAQSPGLRPVLEGLFQRRSCLL